MLVDVSVVVACILFAGLVAPPRPWQLGLRPAPLKFTAQIAAMGALVYFLFPKRDREQALSAQYAHEDQAAYAAESST